MFVLENIFFASSENASLLNAVHDKELIDVTHLVIVIMLSAVYSQLLDS